MAVGALCKRFGVLYILDACQSAGQIQLDVEELGCHVLAVTGRKFLRGPRGTGFLYISRGERCIRQAVFFSALTASLQAIAKGYLPVYHSFCLSRHSRGDW